MAYGICPVCKMNRPLTEKGRLRRHRMWDKNKKEMVECGGARCEPKKVTLR